MYNIILLIESIYLLKLIIIDNERTCFVVGTHSEIEI